MKERNYKTLRIIVLLCLYFVAFWLHLVAFSFLSEVGGLMLCTGECLNSSTKLSSQMVTSSAYGENSNCAFTPLPQSQQPVAGANKGGCKFHRPLKNITVALVCSSTAPLLQRGFLLSLLWQDLHFYPTNL